MEKNSLLESITVNSGRNNITNVIKFCRNYHRIHINFLKLNVFNFLLENKLLVPEKDERFEGKWGFLP